MAVCVALCLMRLSSKYQVRNLSYFLLSEAGFKFGASEALGENGNFTVKSISIAFPEGLIQFNFVNLKQTGSNSDCSKFMAEISTFANRCEGYIRPG